jgi:glycosyltransferase involved in cell wall biosynthesis
LADFGRGTTTHGLRIGINLLFLIPGGVGGTEIYTRNLLRALAELDHTNVYFVFRNAETERSIVPDQANFIDCPQPIHARFRPGRILYEQTAFLAALNARRLDVLLNGGYTAPLLCAVPMATVFFDLQYKVHPEYFTRLDLLAWRVLLPASARRSRRIIAISEAARDELERFYPFCTGRTDLVPHGIERRFTAMFAERKLARVRGSYLLAVSTLGPHKNYDGLLRAYARYRERRRDVPLVIAGIKGTQTEQLLALTRSLDLEDSVTFTGWVAREELYALYENALAFVYPSRFEGFGIPVLEALAAGIPTACSAIPSLIEIAGGCARFFDPDDVDDMVAAIGEITAEGYSTPIREAGHLRAQSYASSAGAAKLVEIFHDMARPAHARKLLRST